VIACRESLRPRSARITAAQFDLTHSKIKGCDGIVWEAKEWHTYAIEIAIF
jgi:hypothetical protein